MAVGPQTVVNGNNGVGIGNGAIVQQSAPGGIAIGQGATSHLADSIALGTQSSAAAVQGVALGAGTSVTQAGGVALGAGSVASTAAGVAGYVPPTATDAQRIAIGATTSTLAAVSVGNAASGQFRQITGVAAGTADSDAVNVSQLRGVQGQVAVIDQSTVKYDTNADGTTNYNSVTMGGSNATAPVTVHNVAPGVAGTDAVNVNQLNAVSGGLNNRINALSDRLDGVEKNAYAGVAAAMALQMPGSYVPGKTVMRIGAGSFKGQSAVGVVSGVPPRTTPGASPAAWPPAVPAWAPPWARNGSSTDRRTNELDELHHEQASSSQGPFHCSLPRSTAGRRLRQPELHHHAGDAGLEPLRRTRRRRRTKTFPR